MKDVWKIINDFYEVSNHGEVRSINRYVNHSTKGIKRYVLGRVLKQKIKRNGYCEVHLSMNCKSNHCTVHRLVAIAFVKNPHNYPQVNHLDGNKQNNHYLNLEWCTSKQNHIHARDIGISHYSDSRNGFAKKVINTRTGETFETAKSAYRNLSPNYGYVYFTRKLSGEKKNETSFMYATSGI